MKKIFKLFFAAIVIFFLIPFEESKADSYTLKSGPYDVENLGVTYRSAQQLGRGFFQMANGDLHVITNYNTNPFQLLDINITQKSYRLVNGNQGNFWRAVFFPANQKVYFGVNYGNTFNEYDPATGNFRKIADMADGGGAQSVIIGDDNKIHIGECCKGMMQIYDPMTDTMGAGIDLDPSGGTYQYSYWMGADTRYAFVALGQNPWYLAVYDKQAATTQLYFKEFSDIGGYVQKSIDGKWYYTRTLSGGAKKYYRFENGLPIEITQAEMPVEVSCNAGISNVNFNHVLCYSMAFNGDVGLPDQFNNGSQLYQWRKLSETDWTDLQVENIAIWPATNKIVVNQPGSEKLLISPRAYDNTFEYDTLTGLTSLKGKTGYSIYDILMNGTDIYFSGYPSATFRYDSTKPWITGSNPSMLPVHVGKYNYYLAKGSDGLIYIGVHHERDSTGGDLAWYNPIDGTYGNLRAPFVDYDVADLKAVLGGTKLAYSATSVDPSDDAKLFIFDVATKKVTSSITIAPAAQAGSAGKIVELEPGIIFGIIKSTDTAKTQIYKVNISTGQIYYNITYPERAFANRSYADDRIVKGPDGYVWLQIGNNMVRINPADGSVEKMILNQTGNPIFHNNTDLYIYGNTELKRVKNIFIQEAKSDLNSDSKIDLSDFNILKTDFLKTTASLTNFKSDIDGDGQATIKDAGILMSGWK
jgi:hypothetical protein